MDVTCDNCKAEYDFDDTLLGDKGTTVKCSKCGHVFRVLPPRREPTRSALKVRFRDGRVESCSSLRELQQRIQAGQVGVDDELGRDGFTFRRLGDVPELRNFFARSVPASGPVATAAAQAATDLPHRGEPRLPKTAPKGTVMGLGAVTHIPAAPRVPGAGPVAGAPVSAAQALAPTQPGATTPKSTLQGRAPISSAPTSPNTAMPRDPAGKRDPISNAPTPTGSAATVPASPSHAATPSTAATVVSSHDERARAYAPTLAAPVAVARAGDSAPAAQRPAGPSLRIPAEPPARAAIPGLPQHGLATDSIVPGALKAAANRGGAAAAVAAPTGKQVRLTLEEDELLPPERTTQGSSRVILYAVAFAGLAAIGWVATTKLIGEKPQAASPSLTPAPAAQPSAPDAGAALGAAQPPAAAPEPAPEPEKQPEPNPTAAATPPASGTTTDAPGPRSRAEPRAATAAPGGTSASAERAKESAASETREPKDYSGWVARGEQLFARGDAPAAQRAFESAVALRGTGSEANSGLGAALLAQGQTREAIPFLTRAAGNGFAEASVGLGDAYRKLGQKDAAIEAYETYLARLPKGARASYVKLQLEGLGRAPDANKPAPATREAPPAAAPGTEYRPAGELTEAPAASPTPAAPEPTP